MSITNKSITFYTSYLYKLATQAETPEEKLNYQTIEPWD